MLPLIVPLAAHKQFCVIWCQHSSHIHNPASNSKSKCLTVLCELFSTETLERLDYLVKESECVRTNGCCETEAKADEGVRERHDRGDDGEPRHVVEVRYEGEEELGGAEDEHVVAATVVAVRVVPMLVVAVRLQNRPAMDIQQLSSSTQDTQAKHTQLTTKVFSQK